jgi:hypothetical protein
MGTMINKTKEASASKPTKRHAGSSRTYRSRIVKDVEKGKERGKSINQLCLY